jgi:DedD protein
MGLLSFFQRRNGAASGAAEGGDPVQAARARARQRLIGATVLVVAAVIGFPLVFETQPRPIPLDIPIEIPRREGAPPLVMPTPRPAAKGVVTSEPAPAPVPAARDEVITETRSESGRPVTGPAASAPVATPAAARASSPAVPAEPAKKAVAEAKQAATPTEAARAKALLEGKVVAKPAAAKVDEALGAGRFVVQVGAFADAAAASATRAKVEKLGFKTYTQVVETSSGSRTRVRVGPFVSRDEADKALARTREAGIPAVVLTL